MPSVVAQPVVQSIREMMNNLAAKTLISWLLQELEAGPKLVEANYLSFFHQVEHNLRRYLIGEVDVTSARKLAIEIHRYARTSVEEPKRFLYRMLGHTAATLHVKTHAFGYLYYWFRYLARVHPTELDVAIDYYRKRITTLGDITHA